MSKINVLDFGLPTTGSGFLAQYFILPQRVSSLDAINFSEQANAIESVASLNTIRSHDPFWDGGPRDSFAARYFGDLKIENAGSYTFYLSSDDGSALYIDGQQVINNNGNHPTRMIPVTLDLSAGEHKIELRYYERGGAQSLSLEWAGPDTNNSRTLLDSSHVTYNADDVQIAGEAYTPTDPTPVDPAPVDPTPTDPTPDPDPDTGGTAMPGLKAEYFVIPDTARALTDINFDAQPSRTETVDSVNKTRSRDAWWDGGPADHFAARFTGHLNVTNPGTYQIFLSSDDGSALYVDGKLVLDNDGRHPHAERAISLDLGAGAHEIEIRYFEFGGDQSLVFEWQGADTGGARQVVSGNALSHGMSSDDGGHDGGSGDGGHDGGSGDGGHDGGSGDGGHDGGSGDGGHDGGSGDGGHDGGSGDGGHDGGSGDGGHDGGSGDGGHDGGSGDGGHDGGSGDGGHDGGGHDDGSIKPPQDPSEIEAFVKAVMAEPETHHDHGDNPDHAVEHGQLLDLVPRGESTHVAVSSGDWFDPNTWYEGRIPDAGAKVFIPKNIAVNYNGESDASINTIRVDGELSFASDVNSKLLVDTMVVTSSGRLEIGTAENPINPNVTVDIVIANNGDIDTNWDGALMSRGVISMGQVEIHGAEKDAFLKVAEAPMSGDTTLRLSEVPDGWKVGDKLVISGTHKTGWNHSTHTESQDEEVVITSIDGTNITFDRALVHDHDTPRADLFAYVANLTRNVTFSSEDGDSTPIHHRGHVMFMHNDDVDVRYAGFDDLGRTDKSRPAFNVSSLSTVESDSNIKSRYPFHFHKTGTADQDDPAMAVGNVVDGSPGWGYAHHDSNANFTGNISFDVFGAGFAAESGNETGVWTGNMAIKSEGIGYGEWQVKEGGAVERQDTGRTGDGFFFAGRLVEAADNVAVNTTNGFVWMHRNTEIDPKSGHMDHPEVAYGADTMRVNLTPIQGFRNNEAFGTETGLMVIKHSPFQSQHDLRSVFDGFLNWETAEGVNISYTAHYTFKNFDLIGTGGTNGTPAGVGVNLGANSYDMVFNGLKTTGFETGVDLEQRFHFAIQNSDVRHVIIEHQATNVGQVINGFNAARHQILDADDLVDGRLSFTHDGDTALSRGEHFNLDGQITDSIGSYDRATGQEPLSLDFYKQIGKLMTTDGYYKTQDGRNVVIVQDLVTDRATGEIMKISHVVEIQMTDQQISNNWMLNHYGGAKYKGEINLGGAAAVARNDSTTTQQDHAVVVDVLANDTDPEGAPLKVDGFTDPEHGDVYMQENGQLLYKPNVGFTGTDTFKYWAADDAGHFSQATVTVEVWDL